MDLLLTSALSSISVVVVSALAVVGIVLVAIVGVVARIGPRSSRLVVASCPSMAVSIVAWV